MKNINLKICFTVIISFAMCSLKAQSLQQKFQKDMELRKKNVNTVLLKAREQQEQQKAERTNEVGVQQHSGNTGQSPIQTVPVQQKNTENKPKTRPENKKPVTTQLVPEKAA